MVGVVALSKADLVEQRIDSHEEICAERYEGINDKIEKLDSKIGNGLTSLDTKLTKTVDDIRGLLIKSAFAVMGGMFAIIMAILFK